MKIEEQNIAAIQAFGYTESEARFLYIVATHSGYFIPRQFIAFTGAKWGKRSTHFVEKIESRGHAGWREYPGIGGVYHLFAKRLYGEIGKENIRNRRRHSVEFIQPPAQTGENKITPSTNRRIVVAVSLSVAISLRNIEIPSVVTPSRANRR
jgi:hypothetical protein